MTRPLVTVIEPDGVVFAARPEVAVEAVVTFRHPDGRTVHVHIDKSVAMKMTRDSLKSYFPPSFAFSDFLEPE